MTFVWLATAALDFGERPLMPAQGQADSAAQRLHSLAASSGRSAAWPPLRQFAESEHDPELRGGAYFVLGYREYEAKNYTAATDDLKRAAETSFSLADYAEYYGGLAASLAHQPGRTVEILDGFTSRHSDSVLRFDALALLADALLETFHADRAIQALTAEPRVRERPALELRLAQAYQRAGKLEDAARSFQEVYYNFPTLREATTASQALGKLRAQLGPARFPTVSDEMETTRPEILFEHSKFAQALKEYSTLLKRQPSSSFAPRWKVGRARCLLRLKRATEALNQLQSSFPSKPAADAERLAALVEVYAHRDDTESMRRTLEKLRAAYPQSPAYASALDEAGDHLVRLGDWQSAAQYYQTLAELFPNTPAGEEASWRLAWSYYLRKDAAHAREAFVKHATRYPDSPHVVAVFYWLGHLAEASGGTFEARAYYELVEKHWAQSYYADAARQRMGNLPSLAMAGPGAAQARSSAEDLAQKIPPPPGPPDLCPTVQSPALRPFSTLTLLGLDDLAEQYLRAFVRERPAAPVIMMALSKMEAESGDYNPSVIEAGRAVPLYFEYDFAQLPREAWTLLYPTLYQAVVEHEAQARGLDPYLVMALIRQESAFDPKARSTANARGLMQILPSTARTRKGGRGASARRLSDPAYNVHLGTDYLQHLLELNHGNFEQAMAAYHAGEERVSAWLSQRSFSEPAEFLESIPIPATRIYVEKVVRDAAIYRRLMTGSPAFKKCGG